MDVFPLFAESVRFRIIEILATGEHSSGLLADVLHHEFGVSRSNVSRHLGVLARSGFAVRRVHGPYRMYRLLLMPSITSIAPSTAFTCSGMPATAGPIWPTHWPRSCERLATTRTEAVADVGEAKCRS